MSEQRTDGELNRIIAEWMGWFKRKCDPDWWVAPFKTETGLELYSVTVPNYCRDLNACHEAENKWCDQPTLPNCYSFEYIYQQALRTTTWLAPFRATARQRAEALVRVIEQQKGVS